MANMANRLDGGSPSSSTEKDREPVRNVTTVTTQRLACAPAVVQRSPCAPTQRGAYTESGKNHMPALSWRSNKFPTRNRRRHAGTSNVPFNNSLAGETTSYQPVNESARVQSGTVNQSAWNQRTEPHNDGAESSYVSINHRSYHKQTDNQFQPLVSTTHDLKTGRYVRIEGRQWRNNYAALFPSKGCLEEIAKCDKTAHCTISF